VVTSSSPTGVAILGGSGFVGRHVARQLLQSDPSTRVRIVGRTEPHPPLDPAPGERLEFVRAELTDPGPFPAILDGMDAVVHLASTTVPETSMEDIRYDLASNASITINLAEALKGCPVRRVVFASSGGTVYGLPQSVPIPETHPLLPISAYGVSKVVSEHYLRILLPVASPECRVVVLRLANVYGEGQIATKAQGVVAAFFERIVRNQPLEIWGDGQQQRDFVHVEDVARAIGRALDADVDPFAVFNIGSGRALSLFDLIGEMRAVVGRDLRHEFNRTGGGHRVDVNLLDIRSARDGLGWSPRIGIAEGLARTWQWTRRRAGQTES
jgi:UDP-glucose 4-epimerase